MYESPSRIKGGGPCITHSDGGIDGVDKFPQEGYPGVWHIGILFVASSKDRGPCARVQLQ